MSHPSWKGAGRGGGELCHEWMAWLNQRKIMGGLTTNRVGYNPPAVLLLVGTILILEIQFQSHLYNTLTAVNYRTEFC